MSDGSKTIAWPGPPPSYVPLTRAFTPASDCFQPIFNIGAGVSDNLRTASGNSYLTKGFTSSCYPSGYSDVAFSTNVVFSPGYCPSGFSTISAIIDPPLTRAFCCPTQFGGIDDFDSSTIECVGYFDVATIVSSGTTSVNTITDDFSDFTVFAKGLVVTLDASDSALLASITAAPASTPSSVEATTTDGGTAAPTSTNTTPIQPQGLSIGAKAGIGAGVAIVALLLIVGAVLFLRRQKKQKSRGSEESSDSGFEKSELSGESKSMAELDAVKVHEIGIKEQPVEMSGEAVRAELEGHSNGWDVPVRRN